MPNDDLGQFPTPTSPTPPLADQPPVSPTTSILEDINAPVTNQISTPPVETSSPSQPPLPKADQPMAEVTSAPAFEETPDVLPSYTPPVQPAETSFPDPALTPTEPEPPQASVVQAPPPVPTEVPATAVPKGGSSFGSLIAIIILLIAGVAIAAAVFLFSQSQQLKQQILEITQTLEKQKTTVTPTPTPTIIKFVTPTPEASISATPTVTLTPTPLSTISAETALPLTNAPKALKIAINHQPNAQLILIKTENATNPQTASTKYFFRQDLTTKKYFYVLITDNLEPEIVDKAIYVTPDNNIPSLNDLVLGNTLGVDLNEAVKTANGLCLSGLCKTASVKSQYIKSGENVIWQLSFTPADTTNETLIIQMNAQTKVVLYKSPGF